MEFLNKNLPKMPGFEFSKVFKGKVEANSKKIELNRIVGNEKKFKTPKTKTQTSYKDIKLNVNVEEIDDNKNEEMNNGNSDKQASLLSTLSEFGKKIKNLLNKSEAKPDLNTSLEKLSSPRLYQNKIQINSNGSTLKKATSSSFLAPLSERLLRLDRQNTKPFSRLLVTNVNDVNGSISAFRKSVINLIKDEKERTGLSVVAPHPKMFMALSSRNFHENLNMNKEKMDLKLDQILQKSSSQVLHKIELNHEDGLVRANQFNMIELKKDKRRLIRSSRSHTKAGLINETPKHKFIRTVTVELEYDKLNKCTISKRRSLKPNDRDHSSLSSINSSLNLISSFDTESLSGTNSLHYLRDDRRYMIFEPMSGECSAENLKRDPLESTE